MRCIARAMFLCLLCFVLGCGADDGKLPKTVKAAGVLTLDGKPVDQATVMFIASSGNHHATATTDSSGRFQLQTFKEKPGAVPGNYKVEVNKTVVSSAGGGDEPTVNVAYGLPAKYATHVTSELAATIPNEGTSDLKIELKSE